MSTYLENYRKRVGLGYEDRRNKLITQAERTFERQLMESPSAKKILATKPNQIDIVGNTNYMDCIILDISNNDIKAFDQKYILVRKDEDFDIGCYVYFDGTYWLAMYKEHRTLDTHKKFTLTKCNNIFNYVVEGVKYEIPIYAQNLSLYSDGLADNKYTSAEDSKASAWFGENPITKSIKVNTRIMLEHRSVFRMNNINDFEFRSAPGKTCAIKVMLLHTAVTDKDDLVNNIAWNDCAKVDEIDTSKTYIVGDKKAMLGSKKTYKCSNEIDYKQWEIECSPELKESITLLTPDSEDGHCEIKFPSNIRFVGEKVKLKLFANDDLMDALEITIKSI